ncbi:MAG: glycine C-acetyltransferase [Planctomycetota bacterium]
MYTQRDWLNAELRAIEAAGMTKHERVLLGPQGAQVKTATGDALNFCANNYLGLSSHPEILAAAHAGLERYGYGLSSVRFICGTQEIHKQLEARIAEFLGTEDSILYSSCFDANGGLFETLMGPEDAIISDELNHASIIDGVRLSKAQRLRYKTIDMADLERCLVEAQGARFRLIATDGVFSMHGALAPLDRICDLAEKYRAQVMVDDSHATGFVGKTGRGTPEHFGVRERIDIITSTLGKALGGASGGFTTGRREIIALLRQRSRPYLFSNTLPPPIAAASIKVLELIDREPERVARVQEHTQRFRSRMTAAGFGIPAGVHPIVPIMIGDERRTMDLANALNRRGIFVVGFSYPVVPRGQARIRVQISAGHSTAQVDQAIDAFVAEGRAAGVIAPTR